MKTGSADRGRVSFSKYDLGLLGLVAFLLILFSAISHNFLSEFNVTTLMLSFAILMLASLGGTLVIMVGCLDLSYSGVLTLSAIVAALLLPSLGLLALLAGVGVGAGFGLVNGILFVKARIPSFLVTLGTLYVSLGLSNLETPGGLSVTANGRLDFLLTPLIPGIQTLLIWAVALAGALFFVTRYTKFGWRVYATGSNELAATLNGIKIGRIRLSAFIISGALAAVAGILLTSYFGSATSSLGSSFVFIPLAVIVLGGTSLAGGIGGPHRTLIGAFLIALILDGLELSGASPGVVTLFEGIAIILTTTIVSREIRARAM